MVPDQSTLHNHVQTEVLCYDIGWQSRTHAFCQSYCITTGEYCNAGGVQLLPGCYHMAEAQELVGAWSH